MPKAVIFLIALVTFTAATVGQSPAALEPTNASSLVTIQRGGTSCYVDGTPALAFGNIVNPDGALSALTISPTQVLVVNEAEVVAPYNSNGDMITVNLYLVGPTGNWQVVAQQMVQGATASNPLVQGAATVMFSFRHGIVVKSDMKLCTLAFRNVGPTTQITFAALHGFFAPDK